MYDEPPTPPYAPKPDGEVDFRQKHGEKTGPQSLVYRLKPLSRKKTWRYHREQEDRCWLWKQRFEWLFHVHHHSLYLCYRHLLRRHQKCHQYLMAYNRFRSSVIQAYSEMDIKEG